MIYDPPSYFHEGFPTDRRYIRRDENFDLITNKLNTDGKIALVGPAYIGKSITVIHYCWKNQKKLNLLKCPQFDATNAKTLYESYKKFARLEEIIVFGPNLERSDLISKVNIFVNKNKPFLFIFDNVCDLEVVKPYLPEPGIMVIYTSRNPVPGMHNLEITPFTRQESLKYLRDNVKCGTFERADELAARLHDRPIMLRQATEYMKTTSTSIPNFLDQSFDFCFRIKKIA